MRYVEPHPKSGVYRVRVPVASHLRAVLGKTAFTKTLGTKDKATAERQAYGVIADFRRLIERAEATLCVMEKDGIASAALAAPGDVAGAIRAWLTDTQKQVADAVWRGGRDAALGQITPEFGSDGPAGFRRAYHHALLDFLANPVAREVEGDHEMRLRSLLRRVMAERGLALPPDDAPLTEAALHLLTDALNILAAEHQKLRYGEWTLASMAMLGREATVHLPPASGPVTAISNRNADAPLAPALTGKTLRAFLIDYFNEGRARSASTKSELELTMRRLLDYLGREDIFLHEVTFEDSKGFRDALLRLPKHMTTKDWERGVRQLVQDYDDGRDQRPRLLPQTVGKPIRLLRSLMALAVKRGHLERQAFEGLLMKGALKAKRPRKPFSPQEIEAIFSAPVFTGCESPNRWWVPGDVILQDCRYWIPLIAQTMGLRLEEAGQLCVSDVVVRHGVACLSITEREGGAEAEDDEEDTATRLKNDSSERFVPLHPLLVELGFLELVRRQAGTGNERLFPELKRNKAGKLTASVSKWFNRSFLPRVGINSPAKKFHSLRHGYCDNARNSLGIKEEVRKALMGHASTAAHDQYGDGHSMAILRQAVDSLNLPGMPSEKLLAARSRCAGSSGSSVGPQASNSPAQCARRCVEFSL